MKKILLALAVVVGGVALAIVFLRYRTQTSVVERHIDAVPVIEISGAIDGAGARQILRALRRAESALPAFVVISLDSPGGEVAGIVEVADAISGLSVPTAGLVGEGVGGTVFMIAAVDRIYFSPSGVCGAASPLAIMGDPEMDRISQKILSYTGAKLRSYAEVNGHDSAIFEAMIDTTVELTRDGKAWKAKGTLLSLTAKEALAIGLSSGIAASPEEVIAKHTAKKAKVQSDH